MTFWNIFIVSKSAIHQRGEHGTAALQVFMSTTTITTVAAASSSAEWCSPCFVVVAAKGRGRGTQRQTRRQNRIDRRRYRRKERDLIKCMSTGGRRREKRDPADFDNDYDALREHLMKENGGPIANALNSLGENAFGNTKNGWLNRNVSWKNVYAFLYSNFLEKMPYKRQRQGLAGQEVSRATIRDESDRQLDEFMSRLERDETLRNDVERVKEFWRETSNTTTPRNAMTEQYAYNLACRTLSLAERVMNSDEKNNAENQDEIAVRIHEISKAITCTPREAVDACHVNPDALSTPSSAFIGRMSKLKTAAPRANCCSMFLTAPKLFMGSEGDEWVSTVSRNAKLLREKFPNVDVDAVVEHDPELLVLPGLEDAVQELLSLWTAEAFALSDVDNDFFAEELSVALRACAPNGGALPEMYS